MILEISDNKENKVDLPEPRNKFTMVYSRPEAATILADATKPASIARGLMMRAIIDKQWAPTSVYTLCRLLKQQAAGELIANVPWTGRVNNGGGKQPYLESKHIDKLVCQWKRGETHGVDSVTKAIDQVADSTV